MGSERHELSVDTDLVMEILRSYERAAVGYWDAVTRSRRWVIVGPDGSAQTVDELPLDGWLRQTDAGWDTDPDAGGRF